MSTIPDATQSSTVTIEALEQQIKRMEAGHEHLLRLLAEAEQHLALFWEPKTERAKEVRADLLARLNAYGNADEVTRRRRWAFYRHLADSAQA